MTDTSDREQLILIWEQHRSRILRYGQALHALLPEGDPPVTLHGRDLRPDDERVGFQFQYTLTGDLYNGDVTTACFVVQVELVKARSIIAKIDAAPLLEYRDGHHEVFYRRGGIPRLGDRDAVRAVFRLSLTRTATRFFTCVRTGERWNEFVVPFGGPASMQQVVIK